MVRNYIQDSLAIPSGAEGRGKAMMTPETVIIIEITETIPAAIISDHKVQESKMH
jgi:hypothetical protein